MRGGVPVGALVALVLLAVLAVLAPAMAAPLSAQAPSPSPSAEARPRLSDVQPMSEDKRIKADAIDTVMADGKVFFLDVREPKEIEELGSYEGYVNIPMSQLESRLGELPRDRPILTA
jgi:hypothetical protein